METGLWVTLQPSLLLSYSICGDSGGAGGVTRLTGLMEGKRSLVGHAMI